MIQQPEEEGGVAGQRDEEGVAEQVMLDIPVDMLPLEIQPQNLPQPKSKSFKIYRWVPSGMVTFLMATCLGTWCNVL